MYTVLIEYLDTCEYDRKEYKTLEEATLEYNKTLTNLKDFKQIKISLLKTEVILETNNP